MKLLDLFIPSKTETVPEAPLRAVIALGGGGARGIAHLGALRAIGESGVQTERIVGVSMGSLIGAVCAAQPDLRLAQAQTIEFLHSPTFQQQVKSLNGARPIACDDDAGGMFSWYRKIQKSIAVKRRFSKAMSRSSLISDQPLRNAIEFLLPDCDIQDLETPMSIVAIDLLSGNQVVLEKGPLRLAVQASAAIPGIFAPVPWEDMLLCDIGSIQSIPVKIARSYAQQLVIGVDVGQSNTRIQCCDTVLDVMMRMDEIGERITRQVTINASDVMIRPEVGNVEWFDFSQPARLIRSGLQAGRQALKQLDDLRAA